MSHTEQANKECDFKWGKKGLAGKKKDVQFYESFTYDGVEYFLYDCVYLYVENEPEPYIGKLIKMWENPDNSKKGKVLWFFKATEIRKYLHGVPLNNEIFLASGEGRGLFNVNHLDVLNGKCNVVCTSKDRRNPQPSEGELKRADYIFYRTFDVGKFKISDKFEDEIAGVDVRNIFNRKKGHRLANLPKIQAKASCGEAPVVVENPASVFNKYRVKDERNSSHPVENKAKLNPSQDSKHFGGIQYVSINNNGSLSDSARALKEQNVPAVREQKSMVSVAEKLTIGSDEGKPGSLVRPSEYKRKAVEAGDLFGMDRKKVKFGEEAKREKGIETISQVSKVTRKQEIDRSNWFKEPWEERLLREYEKGTLVLFQNLDPSYTAEEVQEFVLQAFQVNCTVRAIPRNAFSSCYGGEAFAIFKSKQVAEMVLINLQKKCLMLDNGWPLVACVEAPRAHGKQAKHIGHLSIEKALQKHRGEKRDAVSTSHFPQPNTIEYYMAVEWCQLQEQSELWWMELHKQHQREWEDLRSKLNHK